MVAPISLLVFMGVPGSGKSFLGTCLFNSDRYGQIISTDRIRGELFGSPEIQGCWTQIWQRVEQELRVGITQVHAGQQMGVVYDATNVSRSQRKSLLVRCRRLGFSQITGIQLTMPLWVCLERNGLRSRTVPEPVIERMYRQLRGGPPSLGDGFDRLIIGIGGPQGGLVEVKNVVCSGNVESSGSGVDAWND
ncbi:MAG: AAA family ATPase [Cyanobacteria bacterium P01_H01_bin.15]